MNNYGRNDNRGNYNQNQSNRNQGGYRGGGGYNPPPSIEIPKGFFKDNGLIKSEWLDQPIREFSEYLGNQKNFKTSQLRNFYHEFLRIKNAPVEADHKIIMIKMLKAKVNYKMTAGNAPKEFNDFIYNLVDEIKDDTLSMKRFENACVLMEAMVAFNPKK